MTSRPTARSARSADFVRLPDPPQPEDMNNSIYFNALGNTLHLARHLGNEDTTFIQTDFNLSPGLTNRQEGRLQPDLMIAFNVDPQAAIARNGYVIEEQGKPPDFVLEIGSSTTGRRDATTKRDHYAALGIPEYWRFDHTGGDFQGAPLAGDRLVDGVHQPIPIEQLDAQTHQGYSAVLNLYLRWENGHLGWIDPSTGLHIVRFDDERARANDERARADGERARADDERTSANDERARANVEQARANDEQARADAAEDRVRELEAELARRLQS